MKAEREELQTPSSDALSMLVRELETAIASHRYDEARTLLESNIIPYWFGIPQERFAEILRRIVDTGVPSDSIIPGFLSFILNGFSDTSLPPSTSSPQATAMEPMGAMFNARLNGRPVQALAAMARLANPDAHIRAVFDHVGSWTLFAKVQEGITAMLAGDLQHAIKAFTTASFFPVVPTLAFLHRDAFVGLALIHACFGDTHEASALLERSHRVPRTTSWAEPGIDTAATLVEALVSDCHEEGLRSLQKLDLQLIGERWPFYIIALERHYTGADLTEDLSQQIQLLEELPFPRVNGEGLAGSVFPIASATLVARRGQLPTAWEYMKQADLHIAPSLSHLAQMHIYAGDAAQALLIANQLREQTRGLRQLELCRLGIIASAHLAFGNEQECLSTLQHVLDSPRKLSAKESQFFLDPVHTFARLHLADWPEFSRDFLPSLGSLILRPALTAPDIQILHHLAAGADEQQIAEHEFLPLRDVTTQLQALYNKLGASSRTSAVLAAERRGLL